MDRVDLIIQLTGDQDAIRSMQRIKTEMNALKNTKVQLQVDKHTLDREIADLNRRIRELTHERRRIQLDGGNVDDVNRRIHALQDELNELTAQRKGIQLDIQGIDQAVSGLKAAGQELDNARTKAESLGAALNQIGSALTGAGNFFTSISNMFDSNILDTMERYATVMATRMFTQNWGAARERFDILSTYADYLGMVGVSAEEADASLEKINSKIQGIPVGLSDVAYQTRMYQMYLDDMERATNLAIGLNRALIAGGANEQMRHTAQYEIDRLLATGTLNTSRQWRALIQGLGVSGRFLREEMGYGYLTQNQFIEQLFSKQISGDEFIRGIERLADADSLNQALDIYRTTIESGLSNIYFALTRGKANVISAFNESLEAGTGLNISGWLYEIRDGINEVYKSGAGWIEENPDKIAAGIDKILELLNRLAEFDWAALVDKVGTGVGQYLDILMRLYDAIPDDMFEDFVTFSLVWAGPMGTALRGLGGAVTVLGNALKFLGKQGALKDSLFALQGFKALGAATAPYGLMMAGYAVEAKNAKYELRDYAAALDGNLDKFKERLSASADIGDVEGLEEGLEALNAFREEHQKILDDLKRQREDLGEVDLLDFDEATGKMSEEAQAYADIVNKIAQEKGVVKATIQLYSEYAEKVEVLRKAKEAAAMKKAFPEGLPDIPEEQLQTLTKLVTGWTELREEVEKTINKQIEAFDKVEKASKVALSTLTENKKSQYEALAEFNKEIAQLEEYSVTLGPERGEVLKIVASDVAALGIDGTGIAQGINESISEAIKTGNWSAVDEFLAYFNSALEEKKAAIDMSAFAQTFAERTWEDLQLAFENLEGFGNVINVMADNLKDVDVTPFVDAIITPLKDSSKLAENPNLSEASKALTKAVVDKMSDEEIDMSKFAEAFAASLYEAISTAIEDSEDFENLANLVFGSFETGDTLEAIDSIIEKIEGIRQQIGDDGLTGDVTILNDATTALSSETIPMTAEQFEILLEVMVRLRDEGMAPVKQAEEELIEATNRLRDAIEQLMNLIQQKLSVLQSFKQHLNEVRDATNEAKAAVDALAAAIDALHDKTITITVNTVGGEGLGEGGFSTGGLVDSSRKAKYYASGGSVFDQLFRPSGTDTIPAMLTPGEYVMRKDAVDRLGVPFLQRLNRLDITGALENFTHRYYRPDYSRMMSYHTNNTSYSRDYSDRRTFNVYLEDERDDWQSRVFSSRFAQML